MVVYNLNNACGSNHCNDNLFVAHRRRQKLIEAEERIEALEQLAMAATKPSPDDKQALLKKTLLLQIDIIRAFAEAPTAHNQEALKKISNAGNSDSETDALVNWSELYPVIDELYDNFHANLLNDYPEYYPKGRYRFFAYFVPVSRQRRSVY